MISLFQPIKAYTKRVREELKKLLEVYRASMLVSVLHLCNEAKLKRATSVEELQRSAAAHNCAQAAQQGNRHLPEHNETGARAILVRLPRGPRPTQTIMEPDPGRDDPERNSAPDGTGTFAIGH